MQARIYITATIAALAFCGTAQARPIATIASAHRTIHARYHPADDMFNHYRITACRRVSRQVVDCDLELYDPIQGGTICQPDPDTGDWVCETSEVTPPSERILVTLRVHRDHVWELLN